MNQLGELIRKGRLHMNMTQSQLCKKLGYSTETYISKLERGRCGMHDRKMKKISKVLKIPLEHIHKAVVDDYDDKLYRKLGLGR